MSDQVPEERTETAGLYALVLAGGSGTRLWPLSREEMPKQFLAVCGRERSLLQQTIDRLLKLTEKENIRVVAPGKWRSLIAYQLMDAEFENEYIVEEPEGRNTAPAIALGIADLLDGGASENDVVLVCPSDHIIADEAAFADAVARAERAAAAGHITTFGIKPDAPETGFGYMKASPGDDKWWLVDSFVEKPDLETARKYLEAGDYYWNGGIFCFRIADMIQAFDSFYPAGSAILQHRDEQRTACFREAPGISIDYAVMEQVDEIACIPLDAGWSDVGSWDAVYENSPRDGDDNAVVGNVLLEASKNSLVIGSDRLLCAADLDSMLVVDTPDALFIAPRGSSQKLRKIVRRLSEEHGEEIAEAPMSARPWGTYRVLSKGARQKIKRIEVAPGKRLSLQYHMHRSEHWIVVKGTAKVLICDLGQENETRDLFVHEGESVFVPKGKLHRLENAGRIPLEIIEVQIGEYVGEDDIVRVVDDFGR